MSFTRLVLPLSAALALLCGCSGGGSPGAGGGNVTRDTELTLSKDALILAAGLSPTPWVQLATAQQIDAELKEIRGATPALTEIHARGDEDPKSLIVVVKSGPGWLSKWRDGALTTGDSTLDAALKDYRAKGVSMIGDNIAVLTFDQWMNAKRLAAALKTGAAEIESVEVNGYIGDGDRIVEAKPGEAYTFQRGWGDCPAGCTSRHTWSVTRSGAGWSVAEAGESLPAGE